MKYSKIYGVIATVTLLIGMHSAVSVEYSESEIKELSGIVRSILTLGKKVDSPNAAHAFEGLLRNAIDIAAGYEPVLEDMLQFVDNNYTEEQKQMISDKVLVATDLSIPERVLGDIKSLPLDQKILYIFIGKFPLMTEAERELFPGERGYVAYIEAMIKKFTLRSNALRRLYMRFPKKVRTIIEEQRPNLLKG